MTYYWQIELTRGQIVQLDADDWHKLNPHLWKIQKCGKRLYAARCVGPKKAIKTVYMHRVIIDCLKGLEVDHIDGDGLNNRKGNLRAVTHAQNLRNKKRTSGKYLKGTYFTLDRRWVARITHNNVPMHLGSFTSELEAHQAYVEATKRLDPEFYRFD